MIKNEVYKLMSKRLFSMSLIVLFIVNATAIFTFCKNNDETEAIHNNMSWYEESIRLLNSQDLKMQEQTLESMSLIVDIAMDLERAGSDEEKALVYDIYYPLYPDEYDVALKLNLSEEDLYKRDILINELNNQFSYVSSYSGFIGEIEERAENMKKFSVFADPNSFSYKNIEKTAEDFKTLDNVSPKLGNNVALENATTFVLTDLLSFVLVFLMCIYLFDYERSKGLLCLIRTTKHGHLRLILSKLFVSIATVFIVSILYYGSNLFISGMYTGFGDVGRPVQSIEIFMNCCFKLNVWQYLLLWCLSKATVLCVLALLFALMFSLIKNTALVFASVGAFATLEGVFYFTSSSESFMAPFKYINFIYLLGGNNIFGVYRNINFFTEPISLTDVFYLLMPFLILVSVTVICISFVKQVQITSANPFVQILNRIKGKRKNVGGSSSLFATECFKHYKCSLGILAILLLLFVCYTNLTDDISLVLMNDQEDSYNMYLTEIEGEITEETDLYLQNEREYLKSLETKKQEISENDNLTYDEKLTEILNIDGILESRTDAFNQVVDQVSLAKENAETLHIKPMLLNNLVYKRLVENSSREWRYFTLFMAVVIFISSNTFAIEHKKRTDSLLRCVCQVKMLAKGPQKC